MKFGDIKGMVLFGGGRLMAEFALMIKKTKIALHVITSERHSREIIEIGRDMMPMEDFLRKSKIGYHLSRDISEDDYLRKRLTSNTLGVSFGAAWIFTPSFIKCFRGRLVNVHPTRLPCYRGGASLSWQTLRDDRLAGCSIHLIGAGIDTGDIVMSAMFSYPSEASLPVERWDIYTRNALRLLAKFLDNVKKNADFKIQRQKEGGSTFWPRLNTDINGFIDWGWSLKDIELFIRAFDDPYKGAGTFINNKKVNIKNCSLYFKDGAFHPFQGGLVYRKTKGALYVAAGQGSLIIRSVKDGAGKDVLDSIRLGDRFHTPVKFLDKAKSFRTLYTPAGLKGK